MLWFVVRGGVMVVRWEQSRRISIDESTGGVGKYYALAVNERLAALKVTQSVLYLRYFMCTIAPVQYPHSRFDKARVTGPRLCWIFQSRRLIG